jgi:hypothetical protein
MNNQGILSANFTPKNKNGTQSETKSEKNSKSPPDYLGKPKETTHGSITGGASATARSQSPPTTSLGFLNNNFSQQPNGTISSTTTIQSPPVPGLTTFLQSTGGNGNNGSASQQTPPTFAQNPTFSVLSLKANAQSAPLPTKMKIKGTKNHICKFFLQGNCSRGENCTFLHEYSGAAAAGAATGTTTATAAGTATATGTATTTTTTTTTTPTGRPREPP